MAHPDSLAVAFATHDAVSAGVLMPDTALQATLAHDRADDRLRALAAALPVQDHAGSIAVLLIETGGWTLLTPKDGVWVVSEHVDGPQSGETTLIASELAVRDLASGRLAASDAMAHGLLSVSVGEPLAAALMQAYPDRSSSVVAQDTITSRSQVPSDPDKQLKEPAL